MFVCDQSVVCKAALIFAVTRWLLSLARNLVIEFSNSMPQNVAVFSSSGHFPSSSDVSKILRNSLSSTTLGNIQHRLSKTRDLSCAVCLNRLRRNNKVWELSNCCHVFHKHCLEKWLCHDSRLACPLCWLVALFRRPWCSRAGRWRNCFTCLEMICSLDESLFLDS